MDKSLRLVPEGMSVRLRGDSAFYTRAFLGECERREISVITDEYRFQDVWASVLNNLSELRLEACP